MADQALIEGAGEDIEVQAKRRQGLNGKTLVLFVVLPLLLLIGIGSGLYFSGVFHGSDEAVAEAEEEQAPRSGPAIYFDLPEMLVNLGNSGRASFLKLSVSLEVRSPAAVKHLEKLLPRIVDTFQVYLRELRTEDLSGSAGLQRLREELLLRVNATARPVVVSDVLFKEMLVQ